MRNTILFLLISFTLASCKDEYYAEGRLKTYGATEITNISATLNGSLSINTSHTSDFEVVGRGFVYGNSANININSAKKYDNLSGHGDFSINISGLIPQTRYYARSFIAVVRGKTREGRLYNYSAANKLIYLYNDAEIDTYFYDYEYCDVEILYGNIIEFKTEDGAILPSVTTRTVSAVTETSATLEGTITSVGIPQYSSRGFVYSTEPNPRLGSNGLPQINVTMIKIEGIGTGDFSASATGLTANQTYYVCAYASIDPQNIAYGEEVSFVAETVIPYIELTVAGIAVQKEDITDDNINRTSADLLCRNSIVGGYSDWRIPTIDELATLFSNKSMIGGFKTKIQLPGGYIYTAAYWSNTKSSGFNYYLIDFVSESQLTGYESYSTNLNPHYSYYCRCVRDL